MEKYFESLVSEDTPEAWAALRAPMPWSWAPSDQEKALFQQLDLQELEIQVSDSEQVQQQLESSADGTTFGEFYLEPVLSINGSFYPYIVNCLQITSLPKGSNPSLGNLVALYESKSAVVTDDFSPISYLVIVCPRCQLQFTEGDTDAEFSPEDCVFDDCLACGGAGEWEYEL